MHYCSNLYAVRKMPSFIIFFSSLPFSFFFFFFFLSHSSGRVLGSKEEELCLVREFYFLSTGYLDNSTTYLGIST